MESIPSSKPCKQHTHQKGQESYLFSKGKVERQLYISKGEQGFCLIPRPGKAIQKDPFLTFARSIAQPILQQLQGKRAFFEGQTVTITIAGQVPLSDRCRKPHPPQEAYGVEGSLGCCLWCSSTDEVLSHLPHDGYQTTITDK